MTLEELKSELSKLNNGKLNFSELFFDKDKLASMLKFLGEISLDELIKFCDVEDIKNSTLDSAMNLAWLTSESITPEPIKGRIQAFLFGKVSSPAEFINLIEKKEELASIMAESPNVLDRVKDINQLKAISRLNPNIFSTILGHQETRKLIASINDLKTLIFNSPTASNSNSNSNSKFKLPHEKSGKLEEGQEIKDEELDEAMENEEKKIEIDDDTLDAIKSWFQGILNVTNVLDNLKSEVTSSHPTLEFIADFDELYELAQLDTTLALFLIQANNHLLDIFVNKNDDKEENENLQTILKLDEGLYGDILEMLEAREKNQIYITSFDELEKKLSSGLYIFYSIIFKTDALIYIDELKRLILVAESINKMQTENPINFTTINGIYERISDEEIIWKLIDSPQALIDIARVCPPLAIKLVANSKTIQNLSFEPADFKALNDLDKYLAVFVYSKIKNKRDEKNNNSNSNQNKKIPEIQFKPPHLYSTSFKISIATDFLTRMDIKISDQNKLIQVADFFLAAAFGNKMELTGNFLDILVQGRIDAGLEGQAMSFNKDMAEIARPEKKLKTFHAPTNVNSNSNFVDREKLKEQVNDFLTSFFKQKTDTMFDRDSAQVKKAKFLIYTFSKMSPACWSKDLETMELGEALAHVYVMDEIAKLRETYIQIIITAGVTYDLNKSSHNTLARMRAAHVLATLVIKGILPAAKLYKEYRPLFTKIEINNLSVSKENTEIQQLNGLTQKILNECGQNPELEMWGTSKETRDVLLIPAVMTMQEIDELNTIINTNSTLSRK